MRAVDRGELVELLSYALLKVPPTLRAALVAPEPTQRRQAEALIADRIARDMDQLEIASVASLGLFAADVRQTEVARGICTAGTGAACCLWRCAS